jgi:hypothetical protein
MKLRENEVMSGYESTILFLLTTAFCLFGCAPLNHEKNTSDLVQDYEVPSVFELYPDVKEQAEEWRSDAILEDVLLAVRRDDDPRRLIASFTFRSPEEKNLYINIYFDLWSSHTKIHKVTGEFISERSLEPPVVPTDLPLDSQEILVVALQNGGAEFIKTHRYESLSLDLILENRLYNDQLRLVWRGAFANLTTREGIDIAIDPFSGEVLEVKHFPKE